MRIGLCYRRNKIKKLILIAAFIMFLLYIICRRLEPAYIAQLTCHSNTVITDRVNKAIYSAFDTNEELQFTSMTEDGGVAAISANMSSINRFKAKATEYVQNELNAIASDVIYVPITAILDIPILSGIGMKIPVTIVPMTTVDSDYSESFETTGINQTRYRLDMNIIVGVTYCCFNFTKSEKISISAPVINTVINGSVPSYYGLLSGTDAEIE